MAAMIAAAIVTYFAVEAAVAVAAIYIATYVAVAVAVSLVVNAILSPNQNSDAGNAYSVGDSKDPGVNSRLRINTDNKVGIGYGTFWVKGAEVYGEASSDFKEAYYALVFTEAVSGHANTLQAAYWDEYKLTLDGDGWVTNAVDAAGNTVSDFNGNLRIQYFANSLPSFRGALPNTTWLQSTTNLLTNYTCAVITLKYNRDKQLFALRDMTFCLANDLKAPGDVILDYMTNTLYGCALPVEQVDTDSLTALNSYSSELLTSTTSTGATVTQPRYTLQGVVNTNQNCWKNLEDLMFSCGCYPRVNNQTGQYGVYIDRAATSISFAFDDTTITGSSNLVTAEYASVPNQVEVKFPRAIIASNGQIDTSFKGQQDTFNLELPSNVVPANTQPNKYTLGYGFLVNDVQAKRLAAIDLNNNALDLSYTFRTNHKAITVVSGDVVSITSEINGWDAKLFRVLSVAEQEDQTTGNIQLEFFVKEYDAAVYVDSTVVQYPPAANVNGDSPRAQQSYTPAAPIIANVDLAAPIPSMSLTFTIPSTKVVDQIDVFYMLNEPNLDNAVYMTSIYGQQNDGTIGTGTFTYPILGNGGYYAPQVVPAGKYYLACKYFNDGLATSWSEASELLNWKPTTSQWSLKYAIFRFSDYEDGTGADPLPNGHRYMGIYNSFNPTGSNDPSLYQWFDLGSAISTSNRLFLRVFQNRVLAYKMAAVNPDTTLWNDAYNFPSPTNPVLDLDSTTGFYVKTAYQAGGSNFLTSVWNNDGSITFLLPPGTAVPGTTPITEIASLTVDNEGRLVGFTALDKFYCTITEFTATTTNETFTLDHIEGQALILMNGILLDTSEYTETTTDFTIPDSFSGATVMAMSFRMTNNDGTTSYIPYTRTDISTVEGQDTYSVTFDEGAELLFLNGVFQTDADYSYPTADTVKLNQPAIATGNKMTLISFRLISAIAAPFGQAAGGTVADAYTVDMTGKINTDYTIASINGVYLNVSDFTSSDTQVTLTDPAVFSDNFVESTTFAASGPAEVGVMMMAFSASPMATPTIGSMYNDLLVRIEALEQKA